MESFPSSDNAYSAGIAEMPTVEFYDEGEPDRLGSGSVFDRLNRPKTSTAENYYEEQPHIVKVDDYGAVIQRIIDRSNQTAEKKAKAAQVAKAKKDEAELKAIAKPVRARSADDRGRDDSASGEPIWERLWAAEAAKNANIARKAAELERKLMAGVTFKPATLTSGDDDGHGAASARGRIATTTGTANVHSSHDVEEDEQMPGTPAFERLYREAHARAERRASAEREKASSRGPSKLGTTTAKGNCGHDDIGDQTGLDVTSAAAAARSEALYADAANRRSAMDAVRRHEDEEAWLAACRGKPMAAVPALAPVELRVAELQGHLETATAVLQEVVSSLSNDNHNGNDDDEVGTRGRRPGPPTGLGPRRRLQTMIAILGGVITKRPGAAAAGMTRLDNNASAGTIAVRDIVRGGRTTGNTRHGAGHGKDSSHTTGRLMLGLATTSSAAVDDGVSDALQRAENKLAGVPSYVLLKLQEQLCRELKGLDGGVVASKWARRTSKSPAMDSAVSLAHARAHADKMLAAQTAKLQRLRDEEAQAAEAEKAQCTFKPSITTRLPRHLRRSTADGTIAGGGGLDSVLGSVLGSGLGSALGSVLTRTGSPGLSPTGSLTGSLIDGRFHRFTGETQSSMRRQGMRSASAMSEASRKKRCQRGRGFSSPHHPGGSVGGPASTAGPRSVTGSMFANGRISAAMSANGYFTSAVAAALTPRGSAAMGTGMGVGSVLASPANLMASPHPSTIGRGRAGTVPGFSAMGMGMSVGMSAAAMPNGMAMAMAMGGRGPSSSSRRSSVDTSITADMGIHKGVPVLSNSSCEALEDDLGRANQDAKAWASGLRGGLAERRSVSRSKGTTVILPPQEKAVPGHTLKKTVARGRGYTVDSYGSVPGMSPSGGLSGRRWAPSPVGSAGTGYFTSAVEARLTADLSGSATLGRSGDKMTITAGMTLTGHGHDGARSVSKPRPRRLSIGGSSVRSGAGSVTRAPSAGYADRMVLQPAYSAASRGNTPRAGMATTMGQTSAPGHAAHRAVERRASVSPAGVEPATASIIMPAKTMPVVPRLALGSAKDVSADPFPATVEAQPATAAEPVYEPVPADEVPTPTPKPFGWPLAPQWRLRSTVWFTMFGKGRIVGIPGHAAALPSARNPIFCYPSVTDEEAGDDGDSSSMASMGGNGATVGTGHPKDDTAQSRVAKPGPWKPQPRRHMNSLVWFTMFGKRPAGHKLVGGMGQGMTGTDGRQHSGRSTSSSGTGNSSGRSSSSGDSAYDRPAVVQPVPTAAQHGADVRPRRGSNATFATVQHVEIPESAPVWPLQPVARPERISTLAQPRTHTAPAQEEPHAWYGGLRGGRRGSFSSGQAPTASAIANSSTAMGALDGKTRVTNTASAFTKVQATHKHQQEEQEGGRGVVAAESTDAQVESQPDYHALGGGVHAAQRAHTRRASTSSVVSPVHEPEPAAVHAAHAVSTATLARLAAPKAVNAATTTAAVVLQAVGVPQVPASEVAKPEPTRLLMGRRSSMSAQGGQGAAATGTAAPVADQQSAAVASAHAPMAQPAQPPKPRRPSVTGWIPAQLPMLTALESPGGHDNVYDYSAPKATAVGFNSGNVASVVMPGPAAALRPAPAPAQPLPGSRLQAHRHSTSSTASDDALVSAFMSSEALTGRMGTSDSNTGYSMTGRLGYSGGLSGRQDGARDRAGTTVTALTHNSGILGSTMGRYRSTTDGRLSPKELPEASSSSGYTAATTVPGAQGPLAVPGSTRAPVTAAPQASSQAALTTLELELDAEHAVAEARRAADAALAELCLANNNGTATDKEAAAVPASGGMIQPFAPEMEEAKTAAEVPEPSVPVPERPAAGAPAVPAPQADGVVTEAAGVADVADVDNKTAEPGATSKDLSADPAASAPSPAAGPAALFNLQVTLAPGVTVTVPVTDAQASDPLAFARAVLQEHAAAPMPTSTKPMAAGSVQAFQQANGGHGAPHGRSQSFSTTSHGALKVRRGSGVRNGTNAGDTGISSAAAMGGQQAGPGARTTQASREAFERRVHKLAEAVRTAAAAARSSLTGGSTHAKAPMVKQLPAGHMAEGGALSARSITPGPVVGM